MAFSSRSTLYSGNHPRQAVSIQAPSRNCHLDHPGPGPERPAPVTVAPPPSKRTLNSTIMSKRPTDHLEPSAKKRGNERQLTKDDEEDEEEQVLAAQLCRPVPACWLLVVRAGCQQSAGAAT